ncbi:MAG: glycosyltransferase family 39 protein [Nitrospirales bacterium]|nr:glycosyltransferase family 39 protein [Nitrospirales bacterium]
MSLNRVIVAVFAGALLVRILFNVYLVGMDNPGFALFPDGEEYDALARSLTAGTGFAVDQAPNTFRPPGYPFFLAAIYGLVGPSYPAVKFVQSVLGALTCVFVLLIGARLFSYRVGVIAASIAAVYPFLVVYTGFLLSETLFVFLSSIFLYALVRLREHYSVRWAAVAGFILGLMTVTRPMTLLLPALLLVWAWIEFGDRRRAVMIVGVMVVMMLVPIAPWAVRNYAVTNAFIPISSHLWAGLYAGNNPVILRDPEAIGGSIQPEGVEDYRAAYLSFMSHTLRHEPLELLRLEGHKLKRFWSVLPKTSERDRIISACSYGLLLPLFLVGMYLSLRSPQKPWILFAWILNFCLVTLVTHGSTRFRLPVEPVVILFASLTLERLWVKFGSAPAGPGVSDAR